MVTCLLKLPSYMILLLTILNKDYTMFDLIVVSYEAVMVVIV